MTKTETDTKTSCVCVYQVTPLVMSNFRRQGCTNAGPRVAVATKFCTVALWVLSMDLASCDHPGSWNLEVPRKQL